MAWRLISYEGTTGKSSRGILTVFGLFLLSNVFVLQTVFEERTPNSKGDSSFYDSLQEHFQEAGDQWRLKEPSKGYWSCDALQKLTNVEFVASGWTKSTYKAIYNKSSPVAVKTVNIYGHDLSQCLKGKSLAECYMNASSKILKEIYLLSKLKNEGIIKMLGYCVPRRRPVGLEEQHSVSVLTELGEPFDVIKLLQTPWEDRLKFTLDLSGLVDYLAGSPLGPIRVNDFRRQQFVLADGHLKLTDLDDLTLGDRPCSSSRDCLLSLNSSGQTQNRTKSFVVVNASFECVVKKEAAFGACLGLSATFNQIEAGRHFVNFVLPNGVPFRGLEPITERIVEAYRTAIWDSKRMFQETKNLVDTYSLGKYRSKSKPYLKSYRLIKKSDMPSTNQGRCSLISLKGFGCSMSVVDDSEAAQLCSSDVKCTAFVLTNIKTWTGRRIAYFKSIYTTPSPSDGTDLYVKYN